MIVYINTYAVIYQNRNKLKMDFMDSTHTFPPQAILYLNDDSTIELGQFDPSSQIPKIANIFVLSAFQHSEAQSCKQTQEMKLLNFP